MFEIKAVSKEMHRKQKISRAVVLFDKSLNLIQGEKPTPVSIDKNWDTARTDDCERRGKGAERSRDDWLALASEDP
jgi:hypothetical protein